MITLINSSGPKTFSGLQLHTPIPPLGLAYIAAAIKDAGLPYEVMDGAGEVLGVVRPYPGRDNFIIQGPVFDDITARIHPDAQVPRYAKRSVGRLYTRRRWRKLAETAQR